MCIRDSLCVQLLNGYEADRKAKQERRRELTEQLAASRENEQSVDAWLDMVRDYYDLQELDRPTLCLLYTSPLDKSSMGHSSTYFPTVLIGYYFPAAFWCALLA